MTTFSGHTVVVTGAASGIGRASSLILAERGAQLVLVDIDASGLKSVGDQAARLTSVMTITADAANPTTADDVFA